MNRLVKIVLPFALVVAASGVGLASVPHSFKAGDSVSSSQMNENFADLEQKAVSPRRVQTIGSSSYSVGATTYCGKTDPKNGKLVDSGENGYAAAKSLCEAACNASKSAHVCTTDEVVRLAQMNVPSPASGRISTGLNISTPGPTSESGDCQGWTTDQANRALSSSGSSTQFSPVWFGAFAGYVTCDVSEPLLCCD